MSTVPIPFTSSLLTLRDLTFPEVRLMGARWLVIISFIWPFFNFDLIVPGNTIEVNFFFVFLAAVLLPEVILQDRWSILLALPVFGIALLGASPTAPLRLAIAMVPLHFIINLTRTLRDRGEDLLPPNLAYRALQAFVIFCAAQTIQLNYFHFLPEAFNNVLVALVPRYWIVPYDDLGVHGVQGWASEPSSAALTCIAFALVAIIKRPDQRWRVLGWFVALLLLNKSIYATALAILLLFGCLFTLQRKIYALVALLPSSAAVLLYLALSGRVATLRDNLIADGLNSDVNHELARFVQIISPVQQFPHLYHPVILFGSWVMEPMGLLPLMIGYGSVFGLLWLGYIVGHNFPFSKLPLRPLALVAIFVLFIMASPDLIPSIVAFAAFLVPHNCVPMPDKGALGLTPLNYPLNHSGDRPGDLPRDWPVNYPAYPEAL